MSLDYKLKLLQVFNHIAIIPGMYYIEWKWLFVVLLCHLLFECIGTSIGLHRYFTHKSFNTGIIRKYILAFFGTVSTLGSIKSWVYVHRYHHKTSDTNLDPHKPWNWFHYVKIQTPRLTLIRDLAKDEVISRFDNNYFKIILAYVTILLIINPILVIYAYCFPAVLSFHSASAVNNITHTRKLGKQIYDTEDNSVNNIFVAILTNGEGYHNNHHNDPKEYRFGKYDLGGILIDYIFKTRG